MWEDEDLIASYKKQQEEEAAREQQEALAKEEAAKTLAEVKHAMKIDYFDTAEFLEEQKEKFRE